MILIIQRFSPGARSLFLTNKTDSHDIAELLLKVALNTISTPFYSVSKKYFKVLCMCNKNDH